jgi:anti-anti-sigma regulatory factor
MEQHTEDATGGEVERSPGGITVSGAIDIANATVIGERMCALLTSGKVVVDSRTVTFLDVAGVRMLARFGLAALARGAVVCVRCSSAITETLAVCGVRELPGLQLDHGGPGSPR